MKIVNFFSFLIACSFFIACSQMTPGTEQPNIPGRDPVNQVRSEKRGVSYSFQLQEDFHLLGPAISWSYNWGPSQDAIYDPLVSQYALDFFPMAWSGVNESSIREYKLRHPECEYILAFNEPNLTDQANMTPQEAANRWPPLKALADELGLKIISPAMNYGTLANYSDPIKWLDEFFQLIPVTDIHGISIHCYMSTPSAVKSYIEKFKKYDKPIWMTEFCAWEKSINNAKDQMKFMSNVINYMESDPDVIRYAWFIPRGSKGINEYPYSYLLTKSKPFQLTDLGKVFVNMSTFDKNTYYVEEQVIPAEHYNSISIAESVGSSWTNGPTLQPTTDEEGILELCNFFLNHWVEYQIDVPETRDYSVDVRYSALLDSELLVEVNGVTAGNLLLPNTSEEFIWKNSKTIISLSKGKNTLRLKLGKGRICMNWLLFSRNYKI